MGFPVALCPLDNGGDFLFSVRVSFRLAPAGLFCLVVSFDNSRYLLFKFSLFFYECIEIVGLVGALLWSDKLCLNDILYHGFKGLPVFSYIAKRKQGSITTIITNAATLVPMLPLSKKKSGSPIARAAAKQMICRFVKLKATFVLTLDKSLGTGT